MSWGAVGEGGSIDRPLHPTTFTISESPEGVATAISVLSAGISTTGPERSHPGYRTHPPLVEVGDETYVPPRIREIVPETDIVIDVPSNYAELFIVAPLAYYLGASVRVGANTPRVSGPGVYKSFGPLPAFQHEVADFLKRVFFLDCIVRDVPGEEPPYQRSVLDDTSLDLEELRAATPTERLAAYLGVKRGSVASSLPSWPLLTSVQPSPEVIPCLPFLLDDLSLIYLPEAEEIDQSELLQRALGDFFRGDVAEVNMIAPRHHPGDLHAWLAEDIPIEAYVPSLAAYRNRLTTPQPETPLDVAVVLNDDKMDREYDEVTRFYRDDGQKIDVSVHDSLSVSELSRLFESEQDFVHYIGHCEVGGLQCSDGELDVESLGSVGTRTFFLNACGSYYQGRALVEHGSVAGAATLRTVLNEPARNVGTTFARLFVSGFGIERAMQLARRQITMSTDYAVVGDGTYSLTDDEVAVARLKKKGTTYRLKYTVASDDSPGESYHAPFDLWPQLSGNSAMTEVDRADVPHLLDSLSCPVIFDENLKWSDELADDFLSDNLQ